MREKMKTGSPFLFSLIRLLNFLFGLTAITLFGLSIWLWTQLNKFTFMEVGFLLLGMFEFFLVILACTGQKSTGRLRCYLLLLSLLFIVELTATIIVFATGDKIIDQVIEKTDTQEQIDQFKQYLFVVNYFVIGTLVVEALLIGFVKCYIGSLRERNNEYDYKIVDDEGNKLTIAEKQMNDTKTIQDKYAKKREEMNQKYGRT